MKQRRKVFRLYMKLCKRSYGTGILYSLEFHPLAIKFRRTNLDDLKDSFDIVCYTLKQSPDELINIMRQEIKKSGCAATQTPTKMGKNLSSILSHLFPPHNNGGQNETL